MNAGIDERTRQERLSDLIHNLTAEIELTDSQIGEYAQELCDIYSETDFRHSYYQISLELEELIADQRDGLIAHFDELQNCANEVLNKRNISSEEKSEILKKIGKLYDHVNLETIRLARIDRVEYIGKNANEALTSASGTLAETEAQAKNLSNQVSGYHAQSITILGIFAGLVVAFSTIMQFTGAALDNLSDTTTVHITFFVCLLSFFLFNITFLLMYCVSKISGKSIASNCNQSVCENCKQCKFAIGRFKKKYPFPFWFNVVAILFCLALCYISAK